MAKEFTNDFDMTNMQRHLLQVVGEKYAKFAMDNRYIDYLNDVCPRCRKKLSVLGRRIDGVKAINFFADPEKKTATLYCLRKDCSKKVSLNDYTHNVPFIEKSQGDAQKKGDRILSRPPFKNLLNFHPPDE